MPIRLEGFRRLDRALAALPGRLEAWADGELLKLAEKIARRGRELVPVDTGALLSTIRVERIAAGYAVVAGEPGVEYAIPVHERLDVYHDQGQAKFIEAAAIDLIAGWKRTHGKMRSSRHAKPQRLMATPYPQHR